MSTVLWISRALLVATWLFCPALAGAQPLHEEALRDPDCPAAVRHALSELDRPEDPETVACAHVAGVPVGASVEVVAGEEGDDVRLHVVTRHADLVVALNDERQRFAQPPLGWIDTLAVRLANVPGAPRLVRISIVSRAGEDYSASEETIVIVDPRALRVLWAGPGAFHQRDYFVCSRVRTTTLRIRGGVLRVRSRVSHAIAPRDDQVPPDLYERLAAECASPSPIAIDFPLAP